MPIRSTPNEADLKGLMIATESTPGVFTTPTRRLDLAFTATPGKGALITSDDATGTYDRTSRIRRAFATPSGNIGGGGVSYQGLAQLGRYAVQGGVTGVSDGNAIPGYTYTFNPNPSADDIDTFTALYGVEGLPWEATGVRLNEFNISGNAVGANDQWEAGGTLFLKETKRYEGFEGVATGGDADSLEMTGAGWTVNEHQGAYVFLEYGSGVGEIRMVDNNTATELFFETPLTSPVVAGDRFYISGMFPDLPETDNDTITMEGTRVFLDLYNPSSSTLGTTNVADRVVSFNMTQTLNLANKRRASGVISRVGRGARLVTGTIQFEYDRWDEYEKWIKDQEVSIRIEKLGPVIDPAADSHHLAQLNFERAVFNTWDEGTDNNNMTVNLAFAVYQEAPAWQMVVKTDLPTLA